ncbi:DoxX family protein [Streptomyces sp. NPDC012794]|uniref:DoxX family protein n=1 Tax=Streptomyces sp. NPDC012794 TaxID=3364850 RepID=UPI0036D1ECCF
MTAILSPAIRSPATTTPYDVGLPVLRAVLGVIMTVHGTQKLFGWFDGPGLRGTGVFFDRAGYPAGETMAAVAGLTETLGGLGLILGLLTPLAAASVVGVMLNAITVKWTGSVFGQKGVEFESLIVAAAITLALTGPGRFALDQGVPFLRRHRPVHGLAALALAAVLAAVALLLRH